MSTGPDSEPAEPMSHREILRAMLGLMAGFFASMLSINIVITALPVVVRQLDGNQLQYSWVLIGTLLANAATTPIWGKMADLFNKKTVFQVAMGVFILGSAVAGAVNSMEVLIVGRVIQGAGVGGLAALSMAIMGSIISPRQRGRYAGYMGAVMASATAAGPLLAGSSSIQSGGGGPSGQAFPWPWPRWW